MGSCVASAELLRIDGKPYTLSYFELKTTSADINSADKLGEGGFRPVCKVWYFIFLLITFAILQEQYCSLTGL